MGAPRLERGRGATLLELLVALALGLALSLALLALLRVHAEVARRQGLTADLQQSLRIARHELERYCRLAGRGGLPAAVAVVVRNNAASGARIAGSRSADIVPGTDVLILRGVFSAEIAEVASVSRPEPHRLALTLRRESASLGAVAPLEPWLETARQVEPAALLLSGGPGSPRCSVAEIAAATGVQRDGSGRLTELVLEVRHVESVAGDELASACEAIEPGQIRRVGVLEEHRFYLRRGRGAPERHPRHRLSRVRVSPGSERAHPSSPAGGVALVDDAVDLQVALAVDLDRDGAVAEGSTDERRADEWRYNDPRDRGDAGAWSSGRVELVRVSLVLRAARASRGHLGPPLLGIEDRSYLAPSDPASALRERLFVRVRATTVVRPRNR